MYLVFLYDKYFLSYREISYFFSAFQKTRQKNHLFCDYSKSNCRIAKPSTWLKSAFDSGKNEYDIIKIGEIFSHILPDFEFEKMGTNIFIYHGLTCTDSGRKKFWR